MGLWRAKKNSKFKNNFYKKRQKDLMKSYFESRKEEIFTNVGVLIYVFDVESKDDILEVK